jgi:predicted DNA-binding transcriptional regulator YafY
MKMERLISIIMVLLDQKRITAKKLAEMYEVSLRTIYRDIDTINRAGIPIHAIPGVSGGFEIMPNYKIDRNVFSTEDLSTILMGLSSLPNMGQGNELVNVLTKIKSFVPMEKAADIEVKANQIYVDLNRWLSNGDIQTQLELIKFALEKRKLLTFEYADRYGNKTARIAEPYQLVLKHSHWYWQGYCLKRNDYRLFRLSRMKNIQIQKNTYVPRDFPKPQLDIDDRLSILQTKIKIRIHKSIMSRVLDYCGYENFSLDHDDEYYIVYFPFIENDYYYHILISFGAQCECLEPLHIREEIRRKIQNLAAIYEND